jgi:hypothetical protein
VRNSRRFFVWVGLILVFIAAIIILRSVQRHRELAETLLWMDQTYNSHDGGHNFGKGHGSVVVSSETGEIAIRMRFVRLGGCKILIKEFWYENPVDTYTLTLCDIDPVSIKVTTFDRREISLTDTSCADPKLVTLLHLNCDSADIGFLTTDGAHVIKEDRMGDPPKPTNKAGLLVDDVAYAQRLAKALKRAVELCGGKPSNFWPPNWKSKIEWHSSSQETTRP